MKQIRCARETEVSQALRTGEWQEALETHAAVCPVCREVLFVSGSMKVLAKESEDRGPLPDPYLVWLKAQLTDRHLADERAWQALTAVEAVLKAAAAATVWGWLAWQWPLIHQKLAEWMPPSQYGDWAANWSLIGSTLSSPASFVYWTMIGLICLIVLLVAEPLFTQD